MRALITLAAAGAAACSAFAPASASSDHSPPGSPLGFFFQRVSGCAALRCDGAASSSTALALPSALAAASSSPFISLPLGRTPGPAGTVAVSPGCVSQFENLVCAFPAASAGNASSPTLWTGAVRVNTTSAPPSLIGVYSGVGASHCYPTDASGAFPANLPAMDVGGDVIFLDTAGASLLLAGETSSPAWAKGLDPEAECPDVIPAVAVSTTGRLMMYLGSIGEIFGYYSDGVPVGSMDLLANVTLLPGPQATDWAPHDGILVPISQQAEVGSRTLIVTRFYLAVDSAEPRPHIRPTAILRLSATDLQDEKVPRIGRPWVIDLPPLAAGVPAAHSSSSGGGGGRDASADACVPEDAGTFAGTETLVVAGPVALASGMIVVGLTCPGSGSGNGTVTRVVGMKVLDSSPSVAWTLDLPAADDVSSSHSSSQTVAPVRWMAVDASLLPQSATAVWLAQDGGAGLVAVDGTAGQVVGRVPSFLDLVRGPGADASCASPLLSSASSLVAEGQMLTSSTFASSSSSLFSSEHSSSSSSSSEGTTGGAVANKTTALVIPAVSVDSSSGKRTHWVLGLELGLGGGTPTQQRAAWCALVPGTVPGALGVEGQMAVLAVGTGSGVAGNGKAREGEEGGATASVLAFVTHEGIFGIGG